MKLKKCQARQLKPGMVVKEDWGINFTDKDNWYTIETIDMVTQNCKVYDIVPGNYIIQFKELPYFGGVEAEPTKLFTRDLHREKIIFAKSTPYKRVKDTPKSLENKNES